jgi:hypothetical protein
MRPLLRYRPTPSMVVAGLALLVALAGTGYATTAMPANSVGTQQLRNNSVISAKVRNGSLLRQDFRQGQLAAGPRGPQGPAGPAGPAAKWALVRADGTIIAQSGNITPTAKPATGVYIINFGSAVTGKLIIASSANATDVGDRGTVSVGPCGGTPEGSSCPSGNDTNHVRVITRKEGDNLAEDHPFYVAVIG